MGWKESSYFRVINVLEGAESCGWQQPWTGVPSTALCAVEFRPGRRLQVRVKRRGVGPLAHSAGGLVELHLTLPQVYDALEFKRRPSTGEWRIHPCSFCFTRNTFNTILQDPLKSYMWCGNITVSFSPFMLFDITAWRLIVCKPASMLIFVCLQLTQMIMWFNVFFAIQLS